MKERVEILERALPESQRGEYGDLAKRLDSQVQAAARRIEQARAETTKKEYETELTRLIEVAHAPSNLPSPNPRTLEQNARLTAKHSVARKEADKIAIAGRRLWEQKYDYLKKMMPDHPLAKAQQEKEAVRPAVNFNHAARQTDRGRER